MSFEIVMRDCATEYARSMQRAEDHAAAVEAVASQFIASVLRGDVQAPAKFAPDVNAGFGDRRPQTLAEVMFVSLDYVGGPSYDELLALLCLWAQRGDPAARDLVQRMADKWAEKNTEEA